jgi:hypothetical protein
MHIRRFHQRKWLIVMDFTARGQDWKKEAVNSIRHT